MLDLIWNLFNSKKLEKSRDCSVDPGKSRISKIRTLNPTQEKEPNHRHLLWPIQFFAQEWWKGALNWSSGIWVIS